MNLTVIVAVASDSAVAAVSDVSASTITTAISVVVAAVNASRIYVV